ncbi:hypothetical protein B0H17DRAFT_1129335 [Mycena rosella]|uniref:Uncharacterized protein n=1 Tax=Mycena rosella TaxID=1033263 RepID=A0AAD7DUJ0_MYCRO|nr:hypothetical protein B0H17DRAFT_1129335 [Mycena rosella]
MLELLIGQAERWCSLQLLSPELISTPREPDPQREHGWVKGLEPMKGCLSALRVLTIVGHTRNGWWNELGGDSLWQGDVTEERDKLRWFETASNLEELVLDAVNCPEEKLLVPWKQIKKYTEEYTERLFTLPLDHLRRMTNLVSLSLCGVYLPAGPTERLEMPNMSAFTMQLTGDARPSDLPDYDRLGCLALSGLKTMELQGEDFGIQGDYTARVDVSIIDLLAHGGRAPWGLVDLTLWTSTGLTTNFASMLLANIPTLVSFTVKQEITRVKGVMTEAFLSRWAKEPFPSLENLTIEGAVGFPEDVDGMVIRGQPWMDLFIDMLEFQFARKLRLMNILPSELFPGYCPFRSLEHLRLEELVNRWSHPAPHRALMWHNYRSKYGSSRCKPQWGKGTWSRQGWVG